MKDRPWRKWLRSLLLAFPASLALVALPATTSAHPLGNFTINHYAEVRVGERAIHLDVVIDMAEIPTFSERPKLDTNGDGTVQENELAAARAGACTTLASSLRLSSDGRPMMLHLTAAGLQLLPGAGGLQTLRIVCEYQVPLESAARPAASHIVFADTSYADRIGWREIVVTGDGVAVSAPGSSATTISERLRHYPADLLVQPLDERSVAITATPGGTSLGPLTVPDAQPLGAVPTGAPTGLAAAVPGGVGEELSALIGTSDLTPLIVVLSLLVAVGLGAVHAVSPGHGKTVMAAYLVGTRGRARHAVGLALAVTVSHTLGVLVLAAVTLLASDLLPPERLYPILGLASGLTVVGIGAWLLIARWRDLQHDRRHRSHQSEAHHDHPHRHGLSQHSHAETARSTLSWRSLLALGLAGGLVPSASALILLLGAVAAGRPAFGLALAMAFGVGMAVVLSGIGLLLAHARRIIERAPAIARFARLAPAVPWVTAGMVLVAGVFLTSQALVQRF